MALEYIDYSSSNLLNNEQTDGCLVCYESDIKCISLPCGCEFCESCLVTWMNCQISELQFQQTGTVECLSQSCKKKFDPAHMLHQLQHAEREKIDDLLFRTYLKKSDDIRHCPNSKCTYAGVINGKEKCRKSLQCELCQNKWRERIHFGFIEELLFRLSSLRVSEFTSNLWEEIFTNRCPICSISIIKNGGCPHMTCKKCGYEFCWYCLHKHKGHMPQVCFATVFAKVVVLLMIVFNILVLTGVKDIIQRGIFNLFSLLIKVAFYDLGIVLSGVLANLIRNANMNRFNPTHKIQVACFSLLLAMLAGVYTCGIWYFELFYHALYCILGQFLIVIFIIMHENFFANWLRKAY